MGIILITLGLPGVLHIMEDRRIMGVMVIPTNVVIVESGFHGPVYGKRSSRSTQLSGDNGGRVARSYNRQAVETNTNERPTLGGRTSLHRPPNQIITIGAGDINPSKVRLAILAPGIVIQGRHGKATREVRGTNQILVTPQGVMIPEEAAAVPLLAGIVADPVPVHPVQVQDRQAAAIN